MRAIILGFFDSFLFGIYFGVAVLAFGAALAFKRWKSVGRAEDDTRARYRAWMTIGGALILLAFGRDIVARILLAQDDVAQSGDEQGIYLLFAGAFVTPLLIVGFLLFRQAGDRAILALTMILLLALQLVLRAIPIGGINTLFDLNVQGLQASQLIELGVLAVIAVSATSRPRTRWISPPTPSHRKHRRSR